MASQENSRATARDISRDHWLSHIPNTLFPTARSAFPPSLKSIEQLAIQVTDDIATNYYRIDFTWANSAGAEVKTDRMQITHTWIRTHGTWQSSVECPCP